VIYLIAPIVIALAFASGYGFGFVRALKMSGFQWKAALLIGACFFIPNAHAEKDYEFGTQWTDGNKAAFLDFVPIVSTGEEADDNDFTFETRWVPSVAKLRPLFCLRRKNARDVQCFFVLKEAAQGEVEVIAMRPRD
jgi:hypothetical protein